MCCSLHHSGIRDDAYSRQIQDASRGLDNKTTVAQRTVILEPEEEKLENVEIVTNEGIGMGKWNELQTRAWLLGVLRESCKDDTIDDTMKNMVVEKVIDRFKDLLSKDKPSNVDKIPERKGFGTLTMAARAEHMKKKKPVSLSSAQSGQVDGPEGMTIGKKLLVANIKALVTNNFKSGELNEYQKGNVVNCIHTAVKRRIKYDHDRAEKAHVKEIEKRRINADRSGPLFDTKTTFHYVEDIKNTSNFDQTIVSSAADEFLSLSGGSAMKGDGAIPPAPDMTKVLSTISTHSTYSSSNDSLGNLAFEAASSGKRKPTIKISGDDSPKKKKSKVKIEYN